MTEYLLFHLYAPLAAWGGVAVGEERPSATHPSRSSLLGLIGAALGLRRDQEEAHAALAAGYRLAVRQLAPGQLLRDYHTVQVPPEVALKHHPARTRRDELLALASYQRDNSGSGTLISRREYRADGYWQVAVEATAVAPYPLVDLVAALARPRFTLYLGRKACPPALPLQPQLVVAAHLHDAFQQARFTPPDGLKPTGDELFWEEGMTPGVEAHHTFTRRDQPRTRRRWQFDEREEHRAPLTAPSAKE